jgi:hypothetical protein
MTATPCLVPGGENGLKFHLIFYKVEGIPNTLGKVQGGSTEATRNLGSELNELEKLDELNNDPLAASSACS